MSAIAAAAWLGVKAWFGPLLQALGRALADPRVIVALIVAGVGWACFDLGKHQGFLEGDIAAKDLTITAQSDRLTDNDEAFQKIEARLRAMADAAGARAASEAARADRLAAFIKEMQNHETDPACRLSDDDVRLLDELDGPAATKRVGKTSGIVPDYRSGFTGTRPASGSAAKRR